MKILFLISLLLTLCQSAFCDYPTEGYASWYSVESCRRENTSGITASGEKLVDTHRTCALRSRYYLGRFVKVTNLQNNKSIIVRCNDVGPAYRLFEQGRIIDLSKQAFSELAPLREGIIKVKIKILKER